MSRVIKNLSSWFPTRSYTNRAERPKPCSCAQFAPGCKFTLGCKFAPLASRSFAIQLCVNTFINLIQIKNKRYEVLRKKFAEAVTLYCRERDPRIFYGRECG